MAVSFYVLPGTELAFIRRTLAQLETLAEINESRFAEAVSKYRESMALIDSRTQSR